MLRDLLLPVVLHVDGLSLSLWEPHVPYLGVILDGRHLPSRDHQAFGFADISPPVPGEGHLRVWAIWVA